MRRYLLVAIVGCAFVWAASTSQTSAGADSTDTSNPAEAITGDPIKPAPGAESSPKSPFEQYGIGPTDGPDSANWPYETLNAGERAYVDRNRNASPAEWNRIHDAYKRAVQARAAKAAAEAAAIQLGIDQGLGGGVVP